MKILYLTTVNPRAQGDFLEVMTLHGLRTVLGNSIVDWPKKKVMYRDFSETPQRELHGDGFTLYTLPIHDVKNEYRNLDNIDVVLYGVTEAWGVTDYPEINKLTPNVWYIDGHDTSDIKKRPCFKHALEKEEGGVYPMGLGIPSYQIRPINLNEKTQLFQKTAPYHSVFQPPIDLGTRIHHVFQDESEYYKDMQTSFFGLSSRKGSWESLRNYEIMASGSLLLFRDYNLKPPITSPKNLPTFSYSSPEELNGLFKRLLRDGNPTQEYIDMLYDQREWLYTNGTTESLALNILKVINKNLK